MLLGRLVHMHASQSTCGYSNKHRSLHVPGLEQEQGPPPPLPTLGEGRSSELGNAARFMDNLNWRSLAIISSRYSQPARARWGMYADTRWDCASVQAQKRR
jgi:hypothetical protein